MRTAFYEPRNGRRVAVGRSRTSEDNPVHGLIGRIDVVAGKRDELASILLEGTADMPGCRSYVVAADAEDPDALWVTEVWESERHHQASLELPGFLVCKHSVL